MPTLWTVINLVIVGGMIISALVVSFFVAGFRIFLGFSISTWITAIMLGVYSFAEIFSDYSKSETRPTFYSPWIFPVYIYDPKKNDVVSKNMPAIMMFLGFMIMILWSILASVWLAPIHVGISLSIFFEVCMLISVLFMIHTTSFQLNQVTKDIDKKIIRRAWLDAK